MHVANRRDPVFHYWIETGPLVNSPGPVVYAYHLQLSSNDYTVRDRATLVD